METRNDPTVIYEFNESGRWRIEEVEMRFWVGDDGLHWPKMMALRNIKLVGLKRTPIGLTKFGRPLLESVGRRG